MWLLSSYQGYYILQISNTLRTGVQNNEIGYLGRSYLLFRIPSVFVSNHRGINARRRVCFYWVLVS